MCRYVMWILWVLPPWLHRGYYPRNPNGFPLAGMVETLPGNHPLKLNAWAVTGAWLAGISLKKCPSKNNKKNMVSTSTTFWSDLWSSFVRSNFGSRWLTLSGSIETYSPRHTSSMPRGRFTPLKLRQWPAESCSGLRKLPLKGIRNLETSGKGQTQTS